MSRSNASTSGLHRAPGARGLTLVELLIALAVISVLAAMLVPQFGQQVSDQLLATAEIVAADLDYARSLAVVNNSKYRLTFEPDENRYQLRHSGANTLLHVLPASPFRQNSDLPDQQTTDLDDLPLVQPVVRLTGVVTQGGSAEAVDDVEFSSLGGTTRSSRTVIWLACGNGANERHLFVEINPTTGLVEIGSLSTSLPTAVAALVNAE